MSEATIETQTLQDKLRAVFSKLKLPSSPALASQILALANDPDATLEQFAEVILMDAALSARLLKMANAAHLAQRTPVSTIHRAVTVLGTSRVRTVALGFQLVGHLNRIGGCPFDMKTYWQHSVLRGCFAREAAKRVVPSLMEEAFLVGLLQEAGVLMLVQLLGKEYASAYRPMELSPAAFFALERDRFPYTHVDATLAMAAEWGLPEPIMIPLGRHHAPTSISAGASQIDHLSGVSYLAGSLRFCENLKVDPSEAVILHYARQQLRMSDQDLSECFARAAEHYSRMAELLSHTLPNDFDVTEILSEANRQLMAMAGDAEVRVTSAEAERDNIRQEQKHLKTALGEYRDRAARDPLTGTLNRGAITEFANQHITDCRESGTDLSVFFIDLDNFKKLNDTFGHQAGDTVLKGAAATISSLVTNAGCAGRYGGEEFVVVIAGLSEIQAREKAQEIVDAVRTTTFPSLTLTTPVTCSLGAVWGRWDACPSADEFFAAADEQMYLAKRSGKDRCCVRILTQDQPPSAGAAGQTSAPANGPDMSTADSEGMRRIAERLNRTAEAQSRLVGQGKYDSRKRNRTPFCTPCVTHCFTGPNLAMRRQDSYVRNIATGGINVLMEGPIARGEPIEVTLRVPDSTMMYVAGLVAFCRHVEDGVHEVGVQLTTHSKSPIFSTDPGGALKSLTWLAQALHDRHGTPAPAEFPAG